MKARSTLLCISLTIFGLVFPTLVGARINPEVVVGVWLFDNEGDARDATGKGHDGTPEGKVEWVGGKFGLAVEFDGNSAIIVEHADDMNLKDFSVLAWVKIPMAPTDWATIAAKDGWPNRNYGIWLAGGTALAHHSFTSGTAPNNNYVNAVTPVKIGEWHHVAATYDGKVSNLYIDGKLDAKATFGDKPNTTDVPFIMGRTANGSYKLTGSVDEVAVFNVALSEEDIKTIISAGLKLAVTAVSLKDKITTTWANIKSQL